MTTDTATRTHPAESQVDAIERLDKLVNLEGRSAIARQPDVETAVDAMVNLSDHLWKLAHIVKDRRDMSADFVRFFDESYRRAQEAMSGDLIFALRPTETDAGLVEFWRRGCDKRWEGESYCDVVLCVAGSCYSDMAFESDHSGYCKSAGSGKPYKLKPKAVAKAWPEILQRLGGAVDNDSVCGGAADAPSPLDDDEFTQFRQIGEWPKKLQMGRTKFGELRKSTDLDTRIRWKGNGRLIALHTEDAARYGYSDSQ